MKIEVTCCDDPKLLRELQVSALCFDPQAKTFRVPCFEGDMVTELRCPVEAAPSLLQFQWDRVAVHFGRRADAEAFGDWLIDAERRARHGYNTMRD